MKKLLVVLFAAMLVLSLAAVSMAAVTVSGDFRTEFSTTDAKGQSADQTIQENPDFRLIFDGTTAGKTTAHMQIRAQGIVAQQKDAGGLALGSWYCDEYWMNWATSFGNLRLGSWDYKINPQRILAKASANNIIPRSSTQLAYDYTDPSGLYAGLLYDVGGDGSKTWDGAHDVKVGYKTKMYGVELNSYDTMAPDGNSAVRTGTSFDLFYQVMPTIKIYAFNHDVALGNGKDPSGDTFIAALFTNLMGVKGAQVSVEYCLNVQDPIISKMGKDANGKQLEFTPFGLQAIYPFKMGWQAEYELTNAAATSTTTLKNLLRIRVKF